jgi:hypothetical protein
MNHHWLRGVAAGAGLRAVTSCGHDPKSPGIEFMPDMYVSPSVETYQADPYFHDSVSALKPVDGTIPRGYDTYFPYPNTNEGYEAAGANLVNPLEDNEANRAEGKRLFTINCRHCHGDKGDGQGTLRIKGEPFPVPSYFDAVHMALPDGKMFFSITYGKNLMGAHAYLLRPDERWKLILHINEMQRNFLAAQTGTARADSTAAGSQ